MKKVLFVLSFVLMSGFVFTSCEKLDPNAPQACFLTPAEVIAGVPTAFNSSCSVNGISFSWSFGDGGISTDANPFHTYAEGGTYTVTLTVSNAAGKADEKSLSIAADTPSVIEHSGTIDTDETWIEGMHLVTSDVYVDGAILTIAPGAVIRFASGTGLYLGYHSGFSGATLIANGTAQLPITFTSAALTKTVGDWDFIGFYDGASSLSSMQHCLVEYGGGYSDNYGSVHIDDSSVSIDNSTIKFSGSYGISFGDDGFFKSFTGNALMENSSYAIGIYGNYAHTIGTGNTITTDKGILVKADDIDEENAIWLDQTCAYVIIGNIYVGSVTGAKLTLNPGVEVQMGNGAAIYMGYHNATFGTLIAEGTASDRIRFTSSAPAMSQSPGDWDFLAFYDGAGTSSSLAYCDIEYGGGYSENYGMIYVDGSSVSITNSTIMNSQYMGISLRDDGWFGTFTNNTFEGNGDFPIEIYSNFVHTIGSDNIFNSGPGILVKNDDIEQSEATWLKQNIPYILTGTHYVGSASGVTLTVDPGTILKFTANSRLYVGYHSSTFGSLVADGDPANKITFTSGAAAGFEAAGDWDGLWFYDGTGNGTILDNCVISYGGGYSSNSGNLNMKNESAGIPEISNCIIENSGAWGIYLDNNAGPTLTNNTYTNNASGDKNL